MLGTISVFILTLVMASMLTLGILLTLRTRLTSIFARKNPKPEAQTPDADQAAKQNAWNNFISGFTGFLAQVFFTVVLWIICYKTGIELLAQIKAG